MEQVSVLEITTGSSCVQMISGHEFFLGGRGGRVRIKVKNRQSMDIFTFEKLYLVNHMHTTEFLKVMSKKTTMEELEAKEMVYV